MDIQEIETHRLIPYARNAKLHPKDQVDRIARQISEVGFLVPIVVDGEMVVVSGHGRLEAAKALGLERVPVIVASHLTGEQARAFRIADNKVAESGWDIQLLGFELKTLDMREVDLTLAGMAMDEARAAIAAIAGPDSGDRAAAEGSKEISEGEFQNLAHECPKCGFQFN